MKIALFKITAIYLKQFNDARRSSDCTASKEWMINEELIGNEDKGDGVAKFPVLFWNLFEGRKVKNYI
jgi:hypothetical protein